MDRAQWFPYFLRFWENYPGTPEFLKKRVDFFEGRWYNTYLHRRTAPEFNDEKSEEVFGLPNIKSAKKRVLVTQAKAAQNKAARSALKTELKKFDAAVAEGNRSEADIAYKVAVKAVDKAAAKGLLHKNNAANKKSSMTIRLNKLA